MKWFSILFFVAVLFVGSLFLTLIAGLCNVSEVDQTALQDVGLIRGHLLGLFATRFIWSRYPAMPNPWALLDFTSLLLTLPFILGICYLLRSRASCRFPFRFASYLTVAIVPYAIGAANVRQATELEQIGPGLMLMTLGPLYTFIACALVCLAELRRQIRPRGTGYQML